MSMIRLPETLAQYMADLPQGMTDDDGPQAPDLQTRLAWAGFPRKYWRFNEGWRLEDRPSEQALQAIISDLPALVERGCWLYLLGARGVGKTGAMARIIAALDYAMGPRRAGQVQPAFVRYRLAPDLADDLLAWHDRARTDGGVPVDVSAAIGAQVLMVDDLCRLLLMSGYQRDNALYRWDQLTELRDGRGLTVVTANLTLAALEKEPGCARGVDRAREGGYLLEIRGSSRRGR